MLLSNTQKQWKILKKKALEKRLATLNKQKNGLQILRTSLEQETNLFKGEDEFGYSDTFNHFLKQTQDIIIGIAKKMLKSIIKQVLLIMPFQLLLVSLTSFIKKLQIMKS